MTLINRLLASLFFDPAFTRLRQAQFVLAIALFAYFALSSQPLKLTELTSDKLLHFIGNLLLIGSTWTAFFGRIKHRTTILFAVIYSMSIELLQGTTKLRQPDIFDALTNLTGLLLGYGVCLLFEKYLYRVQARGSTVE